MKRLSPKKIQAICEMLLLISVAVVLFGVWLEVKAVIAIGLLLLFGSIVLRIAFYRCPHCGSYLDRSSGDYCPDCGRRL